MSTLSFRNINKIYENKVQAVFDFNLEIKDKEFIVFVGPSGCGKSTTLRMVAGLEDITTGELYIDDTLVNNVAPKDRNIAMVFQNYALYPHMTVYGNMAFALKLRKVLCPVFDQASISVDLVEKNAELRKQIRRLNRKAKKQHEPEEIFAQIDELYNQIFDNEDKIAKEAVQIKGIYNEKIVDLEKQLEKTEASLEKLQKYLEKGGYDEESERMLNNGIEQKESHIADLEKEIEYLKNNEVALFHARKLTRSEIDSAIIKSARILDLNKYLFRKPAALSGGQRQRVALGRAIVRNPKVFLMDEPLSNLDAKLRVQTRSEISKIHKRVNATTIYVTHDQTEAMTMADRIVVMKDGYIQQIGKPEEVYNDPANMFVAGFIGAPAMNFIHAKYDGKKLVVDSKNSLEVNAEQTKLLKNYVGKEVVVGIRPESMKTLTDSKLAPKHQELKLNCDFRELLGYELVLYSYIGDQKLLIKVDSKENIKTGDDFVVGFNTDSLYFFDKETTKRIK